MAGNISTTYSFNSYLFGKNKVQFTETVKGKHKVGIEVSKESVSFLAGYFVSWPIVKILPRLPKFMAPISSGLCGVVLSKLIIQRDLTFNIKAQAYLTKK